MDFVIGCLMFGVGFVALCALASRIFLDTKDRRDEKKLQNY
jgi:hypothetical protein